MDFGHYTGTKQDWFSVRCENENISHKLRKRTGWKKVSRYGDTWNNTHGKVTAEQFP